MKPAPGLALLAALLASGCPGLTLTVLTDAPPGKVAEVDVEEGVLTVSPAVAVALERMNYDDMYGWSPCEDLVVQAPEDAPFAVHPAHLDGWATYPGYVQPYQRTDPQGRDRSVLVLVGLSPGSAPLRVEDATGHFVTLEVEVTEP